MSEHVTSKKKTSAVGVVFAWITVPLLGIFMLWLTATISEAIIGRPTLGDYSSLAAVNTLSSILGVLILSCLFLFSRIYKRVPFFFHLSVGVGIGIILYVLLLALALATLNSYNENSSNNQEFADVQCTTAFEKYAASSSAIVPIRTESGSGTGFIIDDFGTVLTAYHVIEGSNNIVASYASGRVSMSVIDYAPEYDLALLRLSKFDEGSKFSLSTAYSTGDEVFAYGYPRNTFTGGPPTLTSGIVSRVLTTESLRLSSANSPDGLTLLQTDAAINPGNSGGPLIGKCGVIGVVVAISDSAELSDYVGAVSEQGVGYAVSAATVIERFKLPLQ